MCFLSQDLRNCGLVQNAKDNRSEKSFPFPLFFFLFLFKEAIILLRAKRRLLEGRCLAWESLGMFATFFSTVAEDPQESKVPGFFPQ